MPALLALAAAVVFGAADFAGGYATRRAPVLRVTLITNIVGVAVSAALVVVFGGRWGAASVGWGAAAGVCGLAGLVFLYVGLARGPNRLVSPLSAVLAAIVPVTIGFASGERVDTYGAVGLALAVPAIWLVAGGDRNVVAADRASLVAAIGAGAGFGLFFACVAQTPDDAGAVPLFAARIASTSLLLVAASTRPGEASDAGAGMGLPLLAGLLDMTANALFLWSARDGDLAVVGALVSLFPVTTIVLAIVILHERLTRPQALGLVLAVATAALLS